MMYDDKIIEDNFYKITSNTYDFNSDLYSEALESLIFIYKINNPIELLESMSNSDDYSVVFALSYILENTSRDFMKNNKNTIADIIIKAIKKGYHRANFYFSESLLYVMNRDIDYLSYIELLIKSNNIFAQDTAITNTFRLPDEDWKIFNKVSKDVDFSYMMNDFSDFNGYLSIKDKSHIVLYQKKIIAMAYYKKHQSKKDTYRLFGENNPELFDFIFFLP